MLQSKNFAFIFNMMHLFCFLFSILSKCLGVLFISYPFHHNTSCITHCYIYICTLILHGCTFKSILSISLVYLSFLSIWIAIVGKWVESTFSLVFHFTLLYFELVLQFNSAGYVIVEPVVYVIVQIGCGLVYLHSFCLWFNFITYCIGIYLHWPKQKKCVG